MHYDNIIKLLCVGTFDLGIGLIRGVQDSWLNTSEVITTLHHDSVVLQADSSAKHEVAVGLVHHKARPLLGRGCC